jgi:hypothetical protein
VTSVRSLGLTTWFLVLSKKGARNAADEGRVHGRRAGAMHHLASGAPELPRTKAASAGLRAVDGLRLN